MENNTELQMAWDFIEKTGANVFLTGKAGTGKTTFLRELRQSSPKRMVVLAPTGIAAINAGGATIHSFFQLPLSPYIPGASFGGKEQRRYQFGRVKRNIIKTLDLLVIDEISMVRADLLDAVDSVMRRYRTPGKPFGGAQLLLIGDLQQLAPVVKDDEWEMMKTYYDTPYFFSSKALNMTPYQTIELQRVYRQQDGHFLALLNKIRENKADDSTLEELNRRYVPGFTPPRDSDYIRLTTHNYQAQTVNDRELAQLPGQAFTYKAQTEGVFPEHIYPAEESLTLKEGAQVMFIKNAPDRSYYNGMIGQVVTADKNTVRVRSKSTGDIIDLEPAEWTNARYTLDEKSKEITETVEGVFRQYPLRLAWAITIHKSQGLTFEHAIIDASHSFAHGQTYVALSRCKSLEGMVLNAPLTRDAVISDSTVCSFITRAEANRPTPATLSALQQEYTAQTLDELFGFDTLHRCIEMMTRTLSEHFYNKYHMLLTEYTKAMQATAQMVAVAAKFGTQYRGILASGGTAGDSLLQERIHKAATYFAEQTEPLAALFGKTNVETGNKMVRAQFDDRHAQLGEELKLKRRLLEYAADTETHFSANSYLKRKARILLNNEDSNPQKPARTSKSAKASKSQKQPKTPTHRITYDMFNSGMDIDGIAAERGLTTGTIFGHLARYVAERKIPISRIVPEGHIKAIYEHIGQNPGSVTVTEIKEAVDSSITYDEIRLVMTMYNTENKK